MNKIDIPALDPSSQELKSLIDPSWDNQIILGDCIEGMRSLPDNSFDIAIADPPYNVSKGGNWSWDSASKLPGFGGSWSKVMEQWDDMPLTAYLDFSMAWLSEVKRLVKPTGSILSLIHI